jgi:hypothetical protein
MDWFRHENDLSGDSKLAYLAKLAGARRCEMTTFWICLLEHASAHENRGYVGDIDLEMISVTQEIDLVTIKALHALLCNKGTVTEGGYLKQWNRYNGVTGKQAMTSAERVRKHRENKKKQAMTEQGNLGLDVTACNECNDVTTQYTTYTSHLSKKESPLPPEPVDNSKGDFLKNGKGIGFDVLHHLSEDALTDAKRNAPGWDIYLLAQQYNEAIGSGKLDPPRNPDRAFPAWCLSIKQGKPPV